MIPSSESSLLRIDAAPSPVFAMSGSYGASAIVARNIEEVVDEAVEEADEPRVEQLLPLLVLGFLKLLPKNNDLFCFLRKL